MNAHPSVTADPTTRGPVPGAVPGARSAAVTAEPFGTLPDGRPVTRFVLRTPSGTAGILDYGATLQSLTVPDRTGRAENVLLGMADVPGYQGQTAYFGAVIGRFGNRIARGRFTLDGVEYTLGLNDGPNNLHGGPEGFDRRLWTAEPVEGRWPQLRLRLHSPDGDQGFPAALDVTVDYVLAEPTPGRVELWVRYTAVNVEPDGGRSTPLNLTHHAYLNLAGEGSGTVDGQLVRVPASRYTPVDADLIPFGEHAPVEGTPFDLRTLTAFGHRIRSPHEQVLRARGFDHNWVIDDDAPTFRDPWPGRPTEPDGPGRNGSDENGPDMPGGRTGGGPLRLALHATDPGSGRRVDVWSDRPGVQLYTSNALDGTVVGTSGRIYRQGAGFTAETQSFPDSPNQPGFPPAVLGPQQTFRSVTVFALGTD